MSTVAAPLTVEEFLRLVPEEDDAHQYELHHGELIRLTRPHFNHMYYQTRLVKLLAPLADGLGDIIVECPFRALPDQDLRAADVAFISAARMAFDGPALVGAPDLVVEILSPSNTAHEMYEREQLCLAHGCREFWVVDMKRRTIRVSTPTHPAAVYCAGDRIPLPLFDATLAVDEIFVR